MQIGILVCGHAPDEFRARRGDIDVLFRGLLDGRGFGFRAWPVCDMDFPGSPEDADAWLITGSKHGVYEDLPFIEPLETLIRDIRDAGRPLVGICFGHQIVAQAMGGRVEKFSGGWNIGLQNYRMGDGYLKLHAWHQDQVIDLPAGAEVLASSESCRYAALAYGPKLLTIQAHPEFDTDFLQTLINVRAGHVSQAQRDHASNHLDTPTDRPKVADMIASVLQGVPA